MDDQGRYVEPLQVLGEIGGRERGDAVVGVLVAAQHALQPEAVDHALGWRRSRPVEAEERYRRDVPVELGAVGEAAGDDAVEHLARQADRTSDVAGKSGEVGVDLGGGRNNKKKKK